MLRINRDILDAIIDHGRAEAPLEACGYLAAKDGVICRCIAMDNVDASPVHYSMDPVQQFAAFRKCREDGFSIRAVYHSHPETAAYPSHEDIRLAYDPALSYIIVSLAESRPSINSFIIKKNTVIREQIEIIGDKNDNDNYRRCFSGPEGSRLPDESRKNQGGVCQNAVRTDPGPDS